MEIIKSIFHTGDLVKLPNGSTCIVEGSYNLLYYTHGSASKEGANNYAIFIVENNKIVNACSWYSLNDAELIKHADEEIWNMIDEYTSRFIYKFTCK